MPQSPPFCLWCKWQQIEPRLPALLWATFTGGAPIPAWLTRLFNHYEMLRAQALRKATLLREAEREKLSA